METTMNAVLDKAAPLNTLDLPVGMYMNSKGYLNVTCKAIGKYIGKPTPENIERAKTILAEMRGPDYVVGHSTRRGKGGTPLEKQEEAVTLTSRFKETPVKNEHQIAQNLYASAFLRDQKDIVMDLPGPNLSKSLRMFEDYQGIMVAERDPQLFQRILAQARLYKKKVSYVHPGDFFDMIEVVPEGHKVSLINFDGMGLMGKHEFQGIQRLLSSKNLAEKCVLRITACLRGRSIKLTKMVMNRAINTFKGHVQPDAVFTYSEQMEKSSGMPMLTTQFFLEK
jgi:hypothetical protein